MPDQPLLDAISDLNEHDQPYLGTCTLVTGDGTIKVQFNNGRAKVPANIAALVAQHPHVTVIGLDGAAKAAVEPEEDPGPAPVEPVASEESAPEGEESEAVRLAKEHLAAEGEEVPEVETPNAPPAPREGFEAATADGNPRCQAAKADGGQCANPAGEGSNACRLPKHQAQLA